MIRVRRMRGLPRRPNFLPGAGRLPGTSLRRDARLRPNWTSRPSTSPIAACSRYHADAIRGNLSLGLTTDAVPEADYLLTSNAMINWSETSVVDAVDRSSTGTRVPWTWALVKLRL